MQQKKQKKNNKKNNTFHTTINPSSPSSSPPLPLPLPLPLPFPSPSPHFPSPPLTFPYLVGGMGGDMKFLHHSEGVVGGVCARPISSNTSISARVASTRPRTAHD